MTRRRLPPAITRLQESQPRRTRRRLALLALTAGALAYTYAKERRTPHHLRFLWHYLTGSGKPMTLRVSSARVDDGWAYPNAQEEFKAVGKFRPVRGEGIDYYIFYPLPTDNIGLGAALNSPRRGYKAAMEDTPIAVLPKICTPLIPYLRKITAWVFGESVRIYLDNQIIFVTVYDSAFVGVGTPFLTHITVERWDMTFVTRDP